MIWVGDLLDANAGHVEQALIKRNNTGSLEFWKLKQKALETGSAPVRESTTQANVLLQRIDRSDLD